MTYLTKYKTTEVLLMNYLDDWSLCKYIQVNKTINKLSKTNEFLRMRIISTFGNEYLKFIKDELNWIDNYRSIKAKYCVHNHIIKYSKLVYMGDTDSSMPELNTTWTKQKFNLALDVSYNFDNHDIKKMLDNEYWDIFDRLPNFYNQTKIDIYFMKNNNVKLCEIQKLGYNVSERAKKLPKYLSHRTYLDKE